MQHIVFSCKGSLNSGLLADSVPSYHWGQLKQLKLNPSVVAPASKQHRSWPCAGLFEGRGRTADIRESETCSSPGSVKQSLIVSLSLSSASRMQCEEPSNLWPKVSLPYILASHAVSLDRVGKHMVQSSSEVAPPSAAQHRKTRGSERDQTVLIEGPE